MNQSESSKATHKKYKHEIAHLPEKKLLDLENLSKEEKIKRELEDQENKIV